MATNYDPFTLADVWGLVAYEVKRAMSDDQSGYAPVRIPAAQPSTPALGLETLVDLALNLKEPAEQQPICQVPNPRPSIWNSSSVASKPSEPTLPTPEPSTWLESNSEAAQPPAPTYAAQVKKPSLRGGPNDWFRLVAARTGEHFIGDEAKFYVESCHPNVRVTDFYFRVRLLRRDGSYKPFSCVFDSQYEKLICRLILVDAGTFIVAATVSSQGQQVDISGSPCSFRILVKGLVQETDATRQPLPIGTGPHATLEKVTTGGVLGKPWGIAFNKFDENIYLTDRFQHSVLVLNRSGEIIRKFGSFGTEPSELFRPAGVAIDLTRKRVLVADKDNHRLSVFHFDGRFYGAFGRRGYRNGEFTYPWGLDISPDGSKIVVADSRNHRIQVLDGETYEFVTKYSAFEGNPYEYKNHFDYPRDVLFSPCGEHIYVTDFNIGTIFRFKADCTEKKSITIPRSLMRPQGLAWDNKGNLVVCDSAHQCIRVFTPAGQELCAIPGPTSGFQPLTVTCLPNDKFAVVDGASFTLLVL